MYLKEYGIWYLIIGHSAYKRVCCGLFRFRLKHLNLISICSLNFIQNFFTYTDMPGLVETRDPVPAYTALLRPLNPDTRLAHPPLSVYLPSKSMVGQFRSFTSSTLNVVVDNEWLMLTVKCSSLM